MAQHPNRLHTLNQQGRYTSPWSVRSRIGVLLWHIVWLVLFRPTPKPLYRWRTFLLRLFGCRISGVPYVAPSAIIRSPSKLVLEDRACLGPNSEVYNLATVTLRARATVAQQVYLCAGTHDFSNPELPLVVGEIEIGEDAFIGARAFVLPGLVIGEGAIAGACAVVTRDVAPWTIVAGNPAKVVGQRKIQGDRAKVDYMSVVASRGTPS